MRACSGGGRGRRKRFGALRAHACTCLHMLAGGGADAGAGEGGPPAFHAALMRSQMFGSGRINIPALEALIEDEGG